MTLVRVHRLLARSNRAVVLTGLFVLSLALPSAVPAATASNPNASPAALRATDMTRSLLALNARYAAAGSAERAALLSDLVETGRARYAFLAATLDDDPATVLGAVLPAATRARLASVLVPYLEQDVRVDGTLRILHEDRSDGSRFRYYVDSTRGRFSLHFAGRIPDHLLTGAKVSVDGVQIDGMLALGGSTNVRQTAPASVLNTLGAQSTVVLLVNFTDNAVQPYTIADAQAALFGTTSNFFRENSYQQAWLTGNVFGWFTLPLASTTCDSTAIASYAQSAAAAAGIDLSAYAHQVYAFPQTAACGWWGLSTVGGNPSQSWINGSFEFAVLAHELGHGEGLWHSHSLDCGGTAVIGANCAIAEYGDIVDTMGSPEVGHYNAFQKERLGWLGGGSTPPITTAAADGTYAIETFESLGTGSKALKILKSVDPLTGQRTWYYVESRQASGFDVFLTDPIIGVQNVTTGVLVHTGSESSGNSSILLDMTPTTPMYYLWYDPALAVGQTFADPDTGMTITASWVNATGAGVTVKLGGSGTAAPSVVVSTNQSSYSRGQTAYIAVSVKSSKGAPVAGAPVTFTIVKSNGAMASGNATTGSKGTATYKLRLSKPDPVGTYQADAKATVNGQSSTAETTFVVQ